MPPQKSVDESADTSRKVRENLRYLDDYKVPDETERDDASTERKKIPKSTFDSVQMNS